MIKFQKLWIAFVCALLSMTLWGQQSVTIPEIQGSGSISPYQNQSVTTRGTVIVNNTSSGSLGGLYILDVVGDQNDQTSDGIFVTASSVSYVPGDYIEVTGTVMEFDGETQIRNASTTMIKELETDFYAIPYTLLTEAPDSFEPYEGMPVGIMFPLVVTRNWDLYDDGELELSYTGRKITPTNYVLPGSTEYYTETSKNEEGLIDLIQPGYSSNSAQVPFVDAYGSRRTGSILPADNDVLSCIVGQQSEYALYPLIVPNFSTENDREYSLPKTEGANCRIVGFNLEMFFTTLGSYGAGSSAEFTRQRNKILSALETMEADVFGLVELQDNQDAINSLKDGLNEVFGEETYAIVNDGSGNAGSFIKNGFIYKPSVVTPVYSFKRLTSRMVAQTFRHNETGKEFIVSVNHLKAKTCSNASGDDRDQNDGQSCYNARRVTEAESALGLLRTMQAQYGVEEVVLLGDLNSHIEEDPLYVFYQAGMTNQIKRFNAKSYSYMYQGLAGTLDHVLTSEGLYNSVLNAFPWHINADEPGRFGYDNLGTSQDDAFRCSDHDPVIADFNFSTEGSDPNARLTLTDLRSSVAEQTYTYTGEAVVTFVQDWRGQKFVQDETAAILIDDPDGVITSTYKIGDVMSNVKGTLIDYYGMLEFQPVSDPGSPVATGSEIEPEVISARDFVINFEAYESELIRLQDVKFSTNSSFLNGTVYALDASETSVNMRTTFYNVDYIGETIPQYDLTVTGIANSRTDGNYITPRDKNDMVVYDSTSNVRGENLYVVNHQDATISIENMKSSMSYTIVNVNGQRMLKGWVYLIDNNIDVSKLNSGIYLIRLHSAGENTTLKFLD